DAAKAQVALEAAKKRSAEGGAEKEAERLGRVDADLALLRDLDPIDQLRFTVPDNKIPDAVAVASRAPERLRRWRAGPGGGGGRRRGCRPAGCGRGACRPWIGCWGNRRRPGCVPCSGRSMRTPIGMRSAMRSAPRTGRRLRGWRANRGRWSNRRGSPPFWARA